MLDFCYLCAIMEVKTGALVLRTVKYGDSRVIVDMLTAERGRVSFICNLPKTARRGTARKQFFQPMTLLDIVFDYRETAQLQRLRDVVIAAPFVSIPFDSGKLSIMLFLAEFLTYATRDEQGGRLLFDYIAKSLLWLDGAQQAFANFHLVFMMHLTRFVGFYPNLDDYGEGAWFDLRDGCFTRVRPLHADCLGPAEASRIRTLMRMDYENMRLFRMSRAGRNRCLEVVLHYYRLHVPSFPEMRSLEVLRALF